MAKEKLIKQDKSTYKKPRIIFSQVEQPTEQKSTIENLEQTTQEEGTVVTLEEATVEAKAVKGKKSKKSKKNNTPKLETPIIEQ